MRKASIPMTPCPGAVLMAARLTRPGDRICFRMTSANYVVEEVETDSIGNVRHRMNDNTASASYMPGELLWVQRNKEA